MIVHQFVHSICTTRFRASCRITQSLNFYPFFQPLSMKSCFRHEITWLSKCTAKGAKTNPNDNKKKHCTKGEKINMTAAKALTGCSAKLNTDQFYIWLKAMQSLQHVTLWNWKQVLLVRLYTA